MPSRSATTPGLLPDTSFQLSPGWYIGASRPQEQNRAWRITLDQLARFLAEGNETVRELIEEAIASIPIVVIGEQPSGAKNGVNKTYTLANEPRSPDEVAPYLSGVRLARVASSPAPNEFTVTSSTIDTGLAPRSTDTWFVDYIRSA